MARIISSIGRSQLRRLDETIEKRKNIYNDIVRKTIFAVLPVNDPHIQSAYTIIVFRAMDIDTLDLIKECKKRLQMRGSWPTRQRLLPEQDTEVLRAIGREVFRCEINPNVGPNEVAMLSGILNGYGTR